MRKSTGTKPTASLELRKIYQVIPDKAAAELNQVRVIDESGEDCLYPADFFVPVQLPKQSNAFSPGNGGRNHHNRERT